LCVDEVYQGELALLLASIRPDGDRLVGYTLLAANTKVVDQTAVKVFLDGSTTFK
jgi:hypothetical protein